MNKHLHMVYMRCTTCQHSASYFLFRFFVGLFVLSYPCKQIENVCSTDVTCKGQVPQMTQLQQQPHIYHPSCWVIDFIFAILCSIVCIVMIHALTIEISYDYGYHEGNAHVTQDVLRFSCWWFLLRIYRGESISVPRALVWTSKGLDDFKRCTSFKYRSSLKRSAKEVLTDNWMPATGPSPSLLEVVIFPYK